MHYPKLIRALLAWTRDAEGQALAEYGLILTLVAIAAVGGLVLIGGSVATSFTDFVDAAGFGSS